MVEKQMQQLIKQIKEWGIERGIDKCDPLLQTTKTEEEITELKRAIIRYEKQKGCTLCNDFDTSCTNLWNDNRCSYMNDIKDAIGDIFITLVMLNSQISIDIFEKTDFSYIREKGAPVHKLSTVELSMKLTRKLYDLQADIDNIYHWFLHSIQEMVSTLVLICYRYDLTLEECVQYAYNEIKNRKGEIVDGLFVKKEEL